MQAKKMTQFSVYLPNKPGELKKLLLKVKKLNLVAAATFASRDGAIMRLVPQDKGSFENILKQQDVQFAKQDVMIVGVPDDPGGLLKLLTKLQSGHINIEGVYIVGQGANNEANCVVQVEDIKAAEEVFNATGPKAKQKAKGKGKGKKMGRKGNTRQS